MPDKVVDERMEEMRMNRQAGTEEQQILTCVKWGRIRSHWVDIPNLLCLSKD